MTLHAFIHYVAPPVAVIVALGLMLLSRWMEKLNTDVGKGRQ